jgi:hypothetical protein
MIPKIEFKYSWIYDQNWKEWIKVYKNRRIKRNLSINYILNYIKAIEKLWKKEEKRVLQELSKVSGLKWKSKSIYCYVVDNCIPFSDPLTLPVYDKKDYFIDTLIHELIHELFTQKGNIEKSKMAWNYIQHKKYNKESHTTQIHIPLHAIHSHIYLKFFGKERLNRDIKEIKFLPAYRRSWEIVQRDGYENIIKEFRKRIK